MHLGLKVACCIAFGVGVDAVRHRRKISTNSSQIIENPGQQFAVHTPTTHGGSCEAVLFSVGTAMSVTGYDNMASALTAKGFIVAIVDPEKGSLFKNDVDKLRDAYSYAKDNLVSWSDGACGSISKWLMGGHSAGGGAAHKVLAMNPSMADGIFSLDSFTNSGLGEYKVDLPSLHWGFDVTTCFVTKEDAAAAHYGLTETSKRIFVRVHRVYQVNWCGPSPLYHHCSITDGGCPMCTNCMFTPQYFFDDVAHSVHKFSEAFGQSSWNKDSLSLNFTTPADIFVGEDV